MHLILPQNGRVKRRANFRDFRWSSVQQAMIARALAQDGKVMVLDAPTATFWICQSLSDYAFATGYCYKQQKSILVVTHDLEIALETC